MPHPLETGAALCVLNPGFSNMISDQIFGRFLAGVKSEEKVPKWDDQKNPVGEFHIS
jgi:hypothetical protein